MFAALTDLRNPTRVNAINNMLAEARARLTELDPTVDLDKFVPLPTHEQIIGELLSQVKEFVSGISDLDCKLLINRTKRPFIASDFPVVKYNQFLEEKKWQHSKSGYGSVGFQIIIPINYELSIILFDSAIYKINSKISRILNIDNELDVDSLNVLQFLNCLENVYFDEKASESYIKQLSAKAKKYKRANVSVSELAYLVSNNENKSDVLNGKKNLMILGSSDCECNLKINGIKIHSNGRAYKLDDSAVQLRKSHKK